MRTSLIPLALLITINSAFAAPSGDKCTAEITKHKYVSPRSVTLIDLAFYEANPRRGEFEKKDEFQKRVSQAKKSLPALVQKETDAGMFYVKAELPSYEVRYDIDSEKMVIGQVLNNFVADDTQKKYATVSLEDSYKDVDYGAYKPPVKLSSSSSNEIAFISSNPYLSRKKDSYSFKIKPEDAKRVKDSLALIMVGKPTSPYLVRMSGTSLGKGELHRFSRTALTTHAVCAAVIDTKTNQIVNWIK
jgi:hypothetical protein